MKVTIAVIVLLQIVLIASAYAVIVVFRAQIKAQHKLIQSQAKTIRAIGMEIDSLYTQIANYVTTTDRNFKDLKNWAYSQEEHIWYIVNHPEGKKHGSL